MENPKNPTPAELDKQMSDKLIADSLQRAKDALNDLGKQIETVFPSEKTKKPSSGQKPTDKK